MKLRQQSGIHSAELVAGLMILIPIVLYGLDYAAVLYGGQMNSSCCSAACRAAAQGPPSGYASDPANTPKARASASLARMVSPAAVVRVKRTVRVGEQIKAPIPKNPYGGPFQGTVTVKTRCDVFPPFLLPFIPKNVVLYTSQTYPWTYTMAANYSLNQNLPTAPGGAGGPVLPITQPQPNTLTVPNGGSSLTAGTGGTGGSGIVGDLGQPIPFSAP